MLGIRIRKLSFADIGWSEASKRFIGMMMTMFSFGIGLLIALFRKDRRTLADLVAGTQFTED